MSAAIVREVRALREHGDLDADLVEKTENEYAVDAGAESVGLK